MLDLKALLSKILQMLQISETITFTKFNKNWTFYKIGNVVYVYAPADVSGSVPAGFSTIGTLSTSMRPSGNVYLGVTNAGPLDYRLTVDNAGVVRYYQPSATSSAHNAGFCGYSYIANGGGGYLTSKFYEIFSHLERWWEYVRFKGDINQDIKYHWQKNHYRIVGALRIRNDKGNNTATLSKGNVHISNILNHKQWKVSTSSKDYITKRIIGNYRKFMRWVNRSIYLERNRRFVSSIHADNVLTISERGCLAC